MNFDPSIITWNDVFWALSLILLALLVIRFLKLGVSKALAIGTFRSFFQLLALGYLFHFIFNINSASIFFLLITAIILFAGYEGRRRQNLTIPHYYWLQVGAIAFATFIVLGLILTVILDLDPWFNPIVSIPLGGMIMGQALNSSSLLANTMSNAIVKRQKEIELMLGLGATRWQAILPILRESIHSALIPSINSLNTVGIVSIPGVLVGALISGLEPLVAIKYQIMVMYLWISGTTLACAAMGIMISFTYLNKNHQLRRHLLTLERKK
ncbi:MAG: iron export ABC transporter permease subunit FetB [Candidatus Marinimicrobia bacterium]|nr:iron export ABC transporter permease subunit FetB [Candidatus Neomarinimicrobiota bacterium]